MNLGKITSTLKSKFTHMDALGKQIHINDIVDVATNNWHHNICVVEKMSDKFIYCLDKKSLDEGEIFRFGRGIIPTQCLVINELFSSDIQKNIENNAEIAIEKAKQDKKKEIKLSPKFYLVMYYKDKTDFGLITGRTIGSSKAEFIKSFNELKNKFPGYEFYPNAGDEFILKSNPTEMKVGTDVKLFSESTTILSNCFDNETDKLSLTNVPIKIVIDDSVSNNCLGYKFYVHDSYHRILTRDDNLEIFNVSHMNMEQREKLYNSDISGKQLAVCHDFMWGAIFNYGCYYKYDKFKPQLDSFLKLLNY